jgi:hypothetical protein
LITLLKKFYTVLMSAMLGILMQDVFVLLFSYELFFSDIHIVVLFLTFFPLKWQCRSYFIFHGLDINKPQSVFKFLPFLSFTESYIYQV